jgi:hypothetical protein
MAEISPYYYISKWEYYEDRADRLAVIADALAEEIEGLLLSCSDDLEAANYWCDRASRTEARLREIGTALGMVDDLDTVMEYGAVHAKELSADLSKVNRRKTDLWVKLQELRGIIERNLKDLPSEFSQLINDRFWELV